MNGLKVNKLNDVVSITCYNKTENMRRRDALEKFYEGMMCSEGSEHERYETLFFQLLEGRMKCSDSIPVYAIRRTLH